MMGSTIIFLWVPAHVASKGNEMAEKAAMEASRILTLIWQLASAGQRSIAL